MEDSNGELPPWMLRRDEPDRGLRQGMSVREGFSIARTDVNYDEEAEHLLACPGDYLKFHFKLSGESAVSEVGREFVPVEAGHISLFVQPPDSYKRERVRVNTRERAVTLVCDRAFSSTLAPGRADLPSCVVDFLKARISRLSLTSMPMPPQLKPIVESILNPPLSGPLRDMIIEAKAMELLCFTVDQILAVGAPSEGVRHRDRQKILELCQLFDADPACTLSISQLARMLAWNETQMMQCFKAVTGSTISSYRQRARLEGARRQLVETDLSITHIAMDAGYEHPSNFATAFKRTFGISPKMARRPSAIVRHN